MTDIEKHLAARKYLKLSIDLKIMSMVLALMSCIFLLGNHVLLAVLEMSFAILSFILGYLNFRKYKKLNEYKE